MRNSLMLTGLDRFYKYQYLMNAQTSENLQLNWFNSPATSLQKSLQQLKQLDQLIKLKHFSEQQKTGDNNGSKTNSGASHPTLQLNLKRSPSFGPCSTPRQLEETIKKTGRSLRSYQGNSSSQFSRQNYNNSAQSIFKQNRRLKKHATYLVGMNEYLKSQLIRKNMICTISNQLNELNTKYIKQLKHKQQLEITKPKLIDSQVTLVKKKKIFIKPQNKKKVNNKCFQNGFTIWTNPRISSSLNPDRTIDYSLYDAGKDSCKGDQISPREGKTLEFRKQKIGKKLDTSLCKQVGKLPKGLNVKGSFGKKSRSESKNRIKCQLCCSSQNTECSYYCN